MSAAANALRRRSVGGRPSATGSPRQITSCPWCGSEIREQHLRVYEAPSDIGRCVTYCGDNLGRCDFSEAKAPKEGLPVMVVDEEIYRRPPALLIATVDKFAQMPWKGETQMLFGKVTEVCDRHGFLSPEVQDGQSHPARPGPAWLAGGEEPPSRVSASARPDHPGRAEGTVALVLDQRSTGLRVERGTTDE